VKYFSLCFAVSLALVAVSARSTESQVVPCDATCAPPPDSGGCTLHTDGVCSSCPTSPLCDLIPLFCTKPHPGQEGTQIRHRQCPDGTRTEEWTNKACGYCGP